MHEHVPINQFSTDTKNTQYYLKKKELNCDTLLTNQINCIYYKSTYNVCTHIPTHTHKEASICVYYIYCGMCVHCPSSSSRCWSSPLLLRFWLPRQQNTKYKKKKLYFFSLPRSFLLAALYLFGFSACGLVSVSLSRLFSCLLCALLCFCFICYFVVRHINSRSLARCCRRSRALALAAAYIASHYSLNERLRSPLPHTHTKTHPSSSPLPSSLCSLSLSTLFGRFARRRYVQFQPPKAENQ